MTIWLIHGFNVADRGTNTVGRLLPHLEGHNVVTFTYPWTHILKLRSVTKWAIAELADRAHPGDVVVTHSHGAAIALGAADRGVRWNRVILVNPAIDCARLVPDHVAKVDVWYCPRDMAVMAGELYSRVVRLLPWYWFEPHVWGDMGRHGYRGNDRRVTNWRMPKPFGHSGVWKDDDTLRKIAYQARNRWVHEKAPLIQ